MAIKVCHMTSTHRPKDQRIFYKECVSLANAGYEVYLVEQGGNEDTGGVHIVGTQEQNKGRYYRLLVRARHVYKIAKSLDADIYHLHDMELLPYGRKLKRMGKKVIFDSHEDFAMNFADSDALPVPGWMRRKIAKIYGWYERRCFKKFDAVISVTPHICERIAKSNPNTTMVTNYPLLQVDTWKQDMQYHAESGYVAFAGQVSDHYRVAYITKALQAVKNIEFRICGPLRSSSDLDKIMANDTNNIANYLGVLPYMQIPDFFNQSRAAIVLPGYSSNVGGKLGSYGCNKIFEAMSCGVPVICTDYILWKELIEKWCCGICVNPQDEQQLADAVQYVLDHPSEAAEMGKNGRKAVQEQFNWNTQEKALLTLYEKIAM